MLVTQVTELSKSRSKVYIDQKFAFVLYKGELRLYHIKEGEELRTEDYRTIMQEGIYDLTITDKITAGILSAGDHRAGNRICGRLSLYR